MSADRIAALIEAAAWMVGQTIMEEAKKNPVQRSEFPWGTNSYLMGQPVEQVGAVVVARLMAASWTPPHADTPVDAALEEPDPRIAAVLAYVAKLECHNCDHVHNDGEGRCATPIPGYGRPCGCTWGPNDITKDIRDLLAKEKP